MWIIRYSCQILIKLEFIGQIFEKKNQTSNFITIRPVGAKLSLRTEVHACIVVDLQVAVNNINPLSVVMEMQ